MTNEEAIAYGKECLSWNKFSKDMKMYQFIEMAIQALSQEPCDSAISRQVAIDTIESWLSCDDYNETERHIMRAMQSVLYDLPSVTQICEDAISRDAVLDALLKEIEQQIRVYYEMQNGDMSGSNDYKYRAQGLQKAQDIISKHLKGGKE